MINQDLEGAVHAVVRVCETIAESKGAQHVTFYDPQIWQKGTFGDTGSWVETQSEFSGGRGRGRGRGGRGGGGGSFYNRGVNQQQPSQDYYNNQDYYNQGGESGGQAGGQGDEGYEYDPNTETGGESKGGSQTVPENYVSYPSY